MSIVVKRVVGRNNQRWVDLKKDISISLAQLREFVTTVTQKKQSERGFKSTCEQIESFLADAKRSFEVVYRKVFEENGVVDTAEQIEYEADRDMIDGSHLSKLVRGTHSLNKYLNHFNELMADHGVARAAVSISKYKAELLRIIDKSKEHNTALASVIKKYLNSPEFEAAIVAEDSSVAIAETDLTGSKIEKRKFLDELRARIKAAEDEEAKLNGKQSSDDDEDEDVVPEREENFIVEDDGVAHPIPDEDAPEANGNDAPIVMEESFVVNDDDDDDDESGSSSNEAGESDDNDATSSEGGALFEGNLAKTNKKILKDVSKSAFIKNGRALRNNGRLQAYASIVEDEAYNLKVDEYRQTSKPKKTTQSTAGGGGDDMDDEKDYGSELSSSDDQEQKNEITAIMKQIEADRKKAAELQASFAKKDESKKSQPQQQSSSSTSTSKHSSKTTHSNGAANGSEHIKIKQEKIEIKKEKVDEESSSKQQTHTASTKTKRVREPEDDAESFKKIKVKIEPPSSPQRSEPRRGLSDD